MRKQLALTFFLLLLYVSSLPVAFADEIGNLVEQASSMLPTLIIAGFIIVFLSVLLISFIDLASP